MLIYLFIYLFIYLLLPSSSLNIVILTALKFVVYCAVVRGMSGKF